MTSLAKGANLPIPVPAVRARLTWTGGTGVPEVDGSALLLRADGRVASDDDFVFYNQPRHPSGAVRHTGKTGTVDSVEIDLGALPAEVERVVLAASSDGAPFGQVPDLCLVVGDPTDAPLAEFAIDASTETALVSGEFYRRDGAWKFRAVGQGYASGLAGLATDFGISVDEPAPPAPPVPPPAVPAPSPASTAPAMPTLDAGRVSLVKGARVSLVKAGAPPLTRVTMGLGWDPARRGRNIDLDASAIAFDGAGRTLAIVWFTHLSDFGGALRHAGDNLTGRGDGDDEQIHVDLSRLPVEVASLVFTITSFRGQKFTEVANAFCRLVDDVTGQELVRYDLSDSERASAVVMAMLRRGPSGVWEMRAIGEFHDGRTVKKLVDPAARHAAAP